MSEHHAGLSWTRTSENFTYDSYNRAHEITFKHGAIAIPASAAAEYRGDAERVDPEEAFVASLSSCHLLTFLAICARKRLIVDAYEDSAVGTLQKNENGKLAVTHVLLRPRVSFAPGSTVDAKALEDIHHLAHGECFVANSVKTNVTVEPQF
jgi:organic hydroperoxide reductase OsmC/OhrA